MFRTIAKNSTNAIISPRWQIYPPSIPKNCVLSFGFQERDNGSAMTTVLDHSGYANHGTVTTAATAVAPVGLCRNFDGSHDYLDCGNGTSLQAWTKFSLEALVYINTDANRAIFAKSTGDGGTGNDGYYLYVIFSGGNMLTKFTIFQNDAAKTQKVQYSTNGKIPSAGWYHVISVYDGTDMNTYINGEIAATKVTPNLGIYSPANATNLIIGKASASASAYYNNKMRMSRCYNDSLTSVDIKDRYNECAQLVGLGFK